MANARTPMSARRRCGRLLPGILTAQSRPQVGPITPAPLVDRGDARRRAQAQRGEQPDAQRESDDDRKEQCDDEWELGHTEETSAEEDGGRQRGDQKQSGQQVNTDIDGHPAGRAGLGPVVSHGPEPTDARIFVSRRLDFVTYLLGILLIAALVYAAVRVVRSRPNPSSTRVIGPDDDPEFLWRLNHPDNNPR